MIASALFFSVRPLNAPVWRWLEAATPLKAVLIISVSAAVLAASDRKIRTIQACILEIYGSRRKAALYYSGGCLILLAALYLFVRHARH